MENIEEWYAGVRHILSSVLTTLGSIVFGILHIVLSYSGFSTYSDGAIWLGGAFITIGVLGIVMNIYFYLKKNYDTSLPMKMSDRFKNAMHLNSKNKQGEEISKKKRIITLIFLIFAVVVSLGAIAFLVILAISMPNKNDIVSIIFYAGNLICSYIIVAIYDNICYRVYMKNGIEKK